MQALLVPSEAGGADATATDVAGGRGDAAGPAEVVLEVVEGHGFAAVIAVDCRGPGVLLLVMLHYPLAELLSLGAEAAPHLIA